MAINFQREKRSPSQPKIGAATVYEIRNIESKRPSSPLLLVKLSFDLRHDGREHLPIDVIEEIDDEQERESFASGCISTGTHGGPSRLLLGLRGGVRVRGRGPHIRHRGIGQDIRTRHQVVIVGQQLGKAKGQYLHREDFLDPRFES